MKTLTESEIIRLIQQEYDKKIYEVLREIDARPFPGQADEREPVVSPDLKVRHGETGLLYTVDSVSKDDVVLRSPEGDRFSVGADEFEKEYELD